LFYGHTNKLNDLILLGAVETLTGL